MKSSKEIAKTCLPPVDHCGDDEECGNCIGDNWARERIAEAIRQAREDGARWMQTTIINGDDDGFGYDPADVRKVAP